jgi:CheY-like chemotaxis protein
MRAVDIVEDAGFTAVEAVSADEALAILESRSDISLLFSDIQMPGSMDGLKLAHAVHDRWPGIKIVLVSGHIKLTDAEKPADSRFFGKPLEVKADDQRVAGNGRHLGTGNSSGSERTAGFRQTRQVRGLDARRPAWRPRTPDGRKRQPSAVAGTGGIDAKALLAQPASMPRNVRLRTSCRS